MDVKSGYSSTVHNRKTEADRQREQGDDKLYMSILRGKARNLMHRQNWQEVSLAEVVNRFAPGASPIVKGNKIHYRSLDGAIDVLVDIGGGYLRIQDLKHSTRKRPEYLDLSGHNPRYTIIDGKKVQIMSPEQYNPITHFHVKHMPQIESRKDKH
ncbi:hypothetical protein [Bifidobacterium olomucense]|uniref:Uncharacterized protein n=1 Tax=Bifidobacterium olomucense TaxID=2675324 RepID=A0A7Y0HW34_9BIFI|nr:hypothetical protein [Bifidobacterium sp. DSM 109959]NMM97248.1 hypothetical protein [Bifidobacterium sp. DSM 109959]